MEEIMDCLLAKIKRQRAEPYRKITSGQAAFEGIDVTTIDCVAYVPEYKLDDDEWFKVEKFDETDFCLDLLKGHFDPKEHNDIKKEDFGNISYLVSVQNNCFFFQNITPSSFIRLKTIFYGEVPFGEISTIVENNKQIVIKRIPDAIYDPSSKTLFFRDLSCITSIFKNMGELYKEATQKEVDDFLKESFIKQGKGYDSKKVSSLNRKLITVAMDALSKLTPQDQENMYVYVNDYCADQIVFDATNKDFEINSDNDLKTLLYGIHQRFYTTPFSKEKRLANSIRAI